MDNLSKYLYYKDEATRLFLGDCIYIMKLFPAEYFNMILCDLPYGITVRNKWDIIIPFKDLWEQYERISKHSAFIVLTAAQPFVSDLVCSNKKLFKYEWIWQKQQGTGFLNAKKQPLRSHEQVLVFYKQQPTYNPQFTEGVAYKCKSGRGTTNYRDQVSVVTDNNGYRYPLSVQQFAYDRNKLHPTQKPVALFEYLIKTYTNEGDIVLDNCAGSGTTLVAAKKLNRKSIGIEINKEYCEIIKDRLLNANS